MNAMLTTSGRITSEQPLIPRDLCCWYCGRGDHARCALLRTCACWTCFPQPVVGSLVKKLIDQEAEDIEPTGRVVREGRDEDFYVGQQESWPLRARAVLVRYPALVLAAALASLLLTIYLWATGHKLLALLV